MATPLTPDQWLRILRAEGVRVEEYPGWRTRERDAATGKAFGPVRMFLNHHTAGRNAKDVVAKNGVAGLPAPLAHVYLARSGVATMCSAGRANHAGAMAVNAYVSFRDEKSNHPAPSRASGTVDGNDVSYGLEAENLGDGKDVYPREQYDAWVRINAAVCRYHGWKADSIGCHKETSVEGKVDPRGPVEGYGSRGRFEFTPKQFRADVDERLKHPASWSPGSKPAPAKPQTPTPPKETDMATPYELWAYKGRGEDRDAYAYLRDTEAKVDALADKVAGLEQRPLTDDQVAAIAAAVAAHPALAQAIADTLATRLKD
ncbi:peptidoglycan recognition protein family protein [Streptomyces sp. ECR3.8]|uniref:peptidoglycan recognition protein family protein n=1 Tax=Streptomyces sp. ECR3.8 TaxID=3461009 RepID=UPI004041C746